MLDFLCQVTLLSIESVNRRYMKKVKEFNIVKGKFDGNTRSDKFIISFVGLTFVSQQNIITIHFFSSSKKTILGISNSECLKGSYIAKSILTIHFFSNS